MIEAIEAIEAFDAELRTIDEIVDRLKMLTENQNMYFQRLLQLIEKED